MRYAHWTRNKLLAFAGGVRQPMSNTLKNIFGLFLGRPSNRLLNRALAFSLSPDSSWPAQVEKLIKESYPLCSKTKISHCSADAQAVKEYATTLLSDAVNGDSEALSKDQWQSHLLAKYPWVNGKNISKLYSQTQYQLHK